MHIELKKIVERVVRPLPCDKTTKLRMRDELSSQLLLIYDEEFAKDDDETAAIERTANRFGEPAALRQELDATISSRMRFGTQLNHWILGEVPPKSPISFAARVAIRLASLHFVMTFGLLAVLILLGKDSSVLGVWPTFLAISVLFGFNGFLFTICGLAAIHAMKLDGEQLQFVHPVRLVLATVGAGLSLAASYVALMSVSHFDVGQPSMLAIFATVCGIAMLLFLLVIGLIAKVELRDREWSSLDLGEN